jgi:rRNA maturation endonuclease Nob1
MRGVVRLGSASPWRVRCYSCDYVKDFDRQPGWWPRCPKCGHDIEKQMEANERWAKSVEGLGRALGSMRRARAG